MKMQLSVTIAVISLLIASCNSQSCQRIAANDIGSTNSPSTSGLIAERRAIDIGTLPIVQLFRYNVVCEATAGTRDGFRYVSLVADYSDNGINRSAQFDFSCDVANVWGIRVSGSTDNTITIPPDASFDTPVRRDCFLCLSSQRSGTSHENINHCEECSKTCTGLGQCTSAFSFGCCNYYQDGICTLSCNSSRIAYPDNTCDCPEGFTGSLCNIGINSCGSDPCMNSATCVNTTTNFTCICPSDYTGDRCQTLVDPCDGNPCMNSGTCTRLSTSAFSCTCPADYTGDRCQTLVDPCNDNPCMNSGTCTRLSTSAFSCTCPSDYTGDRCQTLVDPCNDNPCMNSGTCTRQSTTDSSCTCVDGFTGDRCEHDIDECTISPSPCMSGSTCQNIPGSYMCQCGLNWEGPRCETCGIQNCSECSGINAICTECDDGFSINAENTCTKIPTCDPMCENGLCVSGTCICESGFTGVDCTVTCSSKIASCINCRQNSNLTLCDACESGLMVIGNECRPPCSVMFCSECDSNNINCLRCDIGYNLNEANTDCIQDQTFDLSDIQIITIIVGSTIVCIFLVTINVLCCIVLCKCLNKNNKKTGRKYKKSQARPPMVKETPVDEEVHKTEEINDLY